MTLIAFLLILGVTARITRLLVDDSITRPVRDWFAKKSSPGGEFVTVTSQDTRFNQRQTTEQTRWQEHPTKFRHRASKFAFELLDCSWCTGVWITGAVLAVANLSHETHLAFWPFLAVWGSISYLTGAAATIINRITSWD